MVGMMEGLGVGATSLTGTPSRDHPAGRLWRRHSRPATQPQTANLVEQSHRRPRALRVGTRASVALLHPVPRRYLNEPRQTRPVHHQTTVRERRTATQGHVYSGEVTLAEATMLTMEPGRTGAVAADELAALESIQRRVLWLATNMIHHANHVRPNLDGSKIGGHQASSASVVSILTALYFH